MSGADRNDFWLDGLTKLSLLAPFVVALACAAVVESITITQQLYGSGSLLVPVAFFAIAIAATQASTSNQVAAWGLVVIGVILIHAYVLLYVYEETEAGNDLSTDITVWIVTASSVVIYLILGFWKNSCDRENTHVKTSGFSEDE